jgi:DNA-directed RNA polymerase specialized sigma24 family protein
MPKPGNASTPCTVPCCRAGCGATRSSLLTLKTWSSRSSQWSCETCPTTTLKRVKCQDWLRGILANRLRDFWRARRRRPLATGDSDFHDQVLQQLEDPTNDLTRLWDRKHDQHVARQLLALVKPDFSPVTWQAFSRVLEGERAAKVAADLGISVNAVYLAKSSVIKRLREEMEGLTD